MITKKADWLNHNRVIAEMLQTRQRVFDPGAKPGSAAHSLTLETEVAVSLTYTILQFGCDKLRGQLAVVGIRIRPVCQEHAVILNRLARWQNRTARD